VLRRVADEPRPEADGGTDGGGTAPGSSHPAWLVARWTARFGAGETAGLIAWNDRRPSLALQAAREPLERIAAGLAAVGVATAEAPHGAGLLLERGRPGSLPGYAEGAFVVQDPAQALVARFAAPEPGSLVYDACAAPGGKTIALGRTAGLVVAGDRSWRRVERLAENLARAGSGREHAVLADAERPPILSADLVLLDAPCLGTGTLARRPDARWRLEPATLLSVTALQHRLLAACAVTVRPGGLLVYATCSLEPEENEDQVDRFITENPGFRREAPPDARAELLTDAGDLLLLPQRHGTDGAYAARLRRTA
jgi:16S rRNA (cytosine967-C5)-methyltransferase